MWKTFFGDFNFWTREAVEYQISDSDYCLTLSPNQRRTDVACPLLACVTGLPLDLSLVNCLLNISDIIVQAMNALLGMDSYWKEVVGEYMKELYKGSVS